MKRENWIDVARGIGIILVIIGHCKRPDLLLKLIQAFHMPLFFIISGYLFRQSNDSGKFIKHKCKAYLVPYFKLAFINLVICLAVKGSETGFNKELIHLAIRYLIGIAYSRGTWYWMPNCSAIWFLTALLMATVILHFIMKLNEYLQPAAVSVCAVIAYAFCTLDIFNQPVTALGDFRFERVKLIWNTDSAIWGVVFMYIGYLLKKHKLFDKFAQLGKVKSTGVALVLLVAGVLSAYYNDIDYLSMNSLVCGNVILSYISSVGISLALFIFTFTFIPNSKLLAYFGKNTISILGYNYIINDLVYMLWNKAFDGVKIAGAWVWQCILQIALLLLLAFVLDKIKKSVKSKKLINA